MQTVRELYGVQRAMQAEHSMIVALRYTAEAQQFSAHGGLPLVDGEELVRIISAGLAGEALELPPPATTTPPACPACGGTMVRRTACRGPHVGEDFFGCTHFPACRGTAALPEDAAGAL